MTHFLSFFLCRIKPIIVHGCGSCTRRQTSKTVLTQSNFKAAGSLLFSAHYVVPADSYGKELLMMISFLWVAFVSSRKKGPNKSPITIEMQGREEG
jgi:hypothetical protein